MKNITVKQESLSNWREEMTEGKKKGLDGKACWDGYSLKGTKKKGGKTVDNCVKVDEAKEEQGRSDYGKASVRNKRKFGKEGEPAVFDASGERGKMIDQRREEHKKKRGVKKEHVEGGIQVQDVADGLNFIEIETVDIIKTQPIKGASNWKLEMVTEMLISEGYNDDEIATILTEGVDDVGGPLSIGGVLSGIMKAGKFTYNLGKNTRGIVNRGIRDTKLTKDIFSTAKKLRNPDGVSITKSPKANVPSKGGGLVKSFKGFIQNIKDAGSNLVNRTKGKLDRINAKKAEIQTTAKDVDVLGGAATTPKPTSTPMKNITPTPIGDCIAKVAKQVKTGATAAVAGSGVVAGSKLTSNSPSKVAIGTEKPLSASIRGDQKKNAPTEIKKDEAPIINDGKKEINPSKNEKIESQPTKRELRNKRNDALSSPEGRRARRDEGLRKAKLKGNPRLQGLERMKTGTPINQLFNKEEVENIQELDNMGGPAAIGAVLTTTLGLGKAAYDGIKNTAENLKKNKEKKQQKIKNLTQSYSWRDELDLQEMGAYRGGGTIIDPSGSRNKFGYPDSLKPGSGPTKEVPLTPSQNRRLVKKKTKTTTVG